MVRSTEQTPELLVILDDRISRERSKVLMRTINAMRHRARIDTLSGGSDEETVLKRLQERTYSLVLLPWHRYFAWSRVEAFYGLTRTSGPTIAGYFAEPIRGYELANQADHYRAILLDFHGLSSQEAVTLTMALANDRKRSGLRPLMKPGTPVYFDVWYAGLPLGVKLDALTSLKEIQESAFSTRLPSIRVAIQALWSIVYEEGPGKADFNTAVGAGVPKAYFQIAGDGSHLAMRLCTSMPAWSPKDCIKKVWPGSAAPSSAAQLLTAHADWVRVHSIADSTDVEVCVGYFASGTPDSNAIVGERVPEAIRSLWIEPIAPQTVEEAAYAVASPELSYLRPLPDGGGLPNDGKVGGSLVEEAQATLRAKDRFLFKAATQIRELRREIEEKNKLIAELRSGGVGTAPPLPPPDAEALLEAFQERYFDAAFQIRKIQLKIAEAEKSGLSPSELALLSKRLDQLHDRVGTWVKRIAQTVEQHKQYKKASGGG